MIKQWMMAGLCLVTLGVSSLARADGFAALVSPPRFEDRTESGKVYRNVIDFYNVGGSKGSFTVRTADWQFNSQTLEVHFVDELSDETCRPWVYLESPTITLTPQEKKRYRFEVHVPKDTPPQECRFAILFTGVDAAREGAVAVSGQLAVVVYLRIGNAEANLNVQGFGLAKDSNQVVPGIIVQNNGVASTRLEGVITGTDPQGREISFVPNSYPVLPGRTDTLALIPQAKDDKTPPPKLVFPIHLKGSLVWDHHTVDIDTVIQDPAKK